WKASLPNFLFSIGSMMSLFSSGDFGVVEVRGRIQYSLAYNSQREELQVKVYLTACLIQTTGLTQRYRSELTSPGGLSDSDVSCTQAESFVCTLLLWSD
uniref:Synaptotagmin like 1 n=1 Tax=Pundamilia nyererei TaxID=303518 RepID=A0A3B4FR21_9CICH